MTQSSESDFQVAICPKRAQTPKILTIKKPPSSLRRSMKKIYEQFEEEQIKKYVKQSQQISDVFPDFGTLGDESETASERDIMETLAKKFTGSVNGSTLTSSYQKKSKIPGILSISGASRGYQADNCIKDKDPNISEFSLNLGQEESMVNLFKSTINESIVKEEISQLKQLTLSEIASRTELNADQAPKQESSAEPQLVQCRYCGRSFFKDRIEKHESVCGSAQQKKMSNVFKSEAQRIPKEAITLQLENQSYDTSKKTSRNQKSLNRSSSKPGWRQKREQLQEMLKCAREVAEAEKKGLNLNELPFQYSKNEDYIGCKYCSRRFAPGKLNIHQANIERHQNICKNLSHRPKPPPHLAKRQNYSLPQKKAISRKSSVAARENSFIQAKKGEAKNIEASLDQRRKAGKIHRKSHKTLEGVMSSAPSSKSSRNKVLKSARFSYNTSIDVSQDEEERGGKTLREWEGDQNPSKKSQNFLMRKCSLSERAQAFASQECPYCMRKFARKAAQRHFQICQEKHKNAKQSKKTHKFLASSQDKRKNPGCKIQSINSSVIKLSKIQTKEQTTPRFKERQLQRKNISQMNENVSTSIRFPPNKKRTSSKVNRSMVEPPEIQRHKRKLSKYSHTEGSQEYSPLPKDQLCYSARHSDQRRVRFQGKGPQRRSKFGSPREYSQDSNEEESSKKYAQQDYLITDASLRGMTQAERALFQTIEELCKRNSVRKGGPPPIFSKEKNISECRPQRGGEGKLALFCTQCGSAFGAGDNFCGYCGQRRIIA